VSGCSSAIGSQRKVLILSFSTGCQSTGRRSQLLTRGLQGHPRLLSSSRATPARCLVPTRECLGRHPRPTTSAIRIRRPSCSASQSGRSTLRTKTSCRQSDTGGTSTSSFSGAAATLPWGSPATARRTAGPTSGLPSSHRRVSSRCQKPRRATWRASTASRCGSWRSIS